MNTVLLTAEQVAERLQVREETVYDWLRAGRLRGVKLGRIWRAREEDLENFIRAHLTGPKPDEDEEPLSPEDLAAFRRGTEDIKAGRYITLDELDAWREAGAEDAARRLGEVEAEIPPEELNAYLTEIAKRAKPVRWNAKRSEFEEVKP